MQEPIVEASAVATLDVPPGEARQLGLVMAECWRTDLSRVPEPTRLRYSDLLCDRDLLLEGLRRKAAEVGGTLLVDADCHGDPSELTCRAEVYRVDAASDAKEDAEPTPAGADHPWQTDVEFHPSDDFQKRPLAQRGARSATRVSLLHYRRANEVSLGELSVECAECSADELAASLRAAAGSLGARTVVELSCRDSLDAGRLCSAKLAGHADPAADPETL